MRLQSAIKRKAFNIARANVIEALRAQGIKLAFVDSKEINRVAKELLGKEQAALYAMAKRRLSRR